jgi:hypothetical protein
MRRNDDFLKIALAASAFTLSSCANVAPDVATTAPVVCLSGADCERKWSRVAAWVAQNAFYKIDTQSDALIKTSAPQGKSPGIAVKAEKLPAADGAMTIVAEIRCANLFGCVPDLPELTQSFAAYVSGASDLVVAMPGPPRLVRSPPLLGDPLVLFQ